MHVLTVARDQLININYAFLNSAKLKNTGILGVARRYLLRIIFCRIFAD